MPKLSDLNLLYDGYLASMRGSSWKEEPQRFEINMLSELVKLKDEIDSRKYRTSACTEFTLSERGKIRHIHGGRIRDRIVRHSLCDNELEPKLKPYLIYNNGASQQGKGLAFARKMFERDLHNFWLKYRTNDGYIAFVDFSKFFDNVQHEKIREMLYPKISEEAQWIVDEALHSFEVDVSYMTDEEFSRCMDVKFDSVKYYETIPKEARTGKKIMKKSVNIGDQISQKIGIFFPTPIDNYAKIVRGCKWYGRYMDDIYIIHKDREFLKSVISGIKKKAAEIGMFINDRKTRIVKLSQTFKFLQIKYSLSETGKVIKRINSANVTRCRRRWKAYKRLLFSGKMTFESVEQSCKSWMGEYTGLMSKVQTKHMKALYRELFGKEITWKQRLYLQMAVN